MVAVAGRGGGAARSATLGAARRGVRIRAAMFIGFMACGLAACVDRECDCGATFSDNGLGDRWLKACHVTVAVGGANTAVVEVARLAPRDGCLSPAEPRLRLVWDGSGAVVQGTAASPPTARRVARAPDIGGFGDDYRDVLPGLDITVSPGIYTGTVDVRFFEGARIVSLTCASAPTISCR